MTRADESILRWQTRVSLGAIFGGLTLAALIAIYGLVAGTFDAFNGGFFGAALVMLGNGILSLLTLQPLRRGDIRLFGHIVWVIVWIVGLTMCLGVLTFTGRDGEFAELPLRLGGTGLLLVAPVCFGLYFAFLPNTPIAIKSIAMVFILGLVVAALGIILAIWTEGRGEPVMPRRWFGTVMVITSIGGLISLFGLMVTHSLARAFAKKRTADPESVARRLRLTMTCPLCGKEGELPTGFTKCPSCAGVLEIEVEEPRCQCGYLLFQLVGDRCPECGRDVPDDQRWAPPIAPRHEAAPPVAPPPTAGDGS